MSFQKTSLILGLLLGLVFSSCSITKDFKSNDKQVKESIQQYLSQAEKFDDDFLLNKIPLEDKSYCPVLSEPYWVVSPESIIDNLNIQKANNNVSIAIFNQKIYLAFRTGPTHFASKKTGVYVISSADGQNWDEELSLFFGKDVREPFLIEINGSLHFYYFTAGTKMTAFEPEKISHFILNEHGNWQALKDVLNKGEIHWSMKKRNGTVFLSTYIGSHYQLKGDSDVSVFLRQTLDGEHFFPSEDTARVYWGGVSESAFEFDYDGNLWAVTRLEDGDKTGFGSHVVYADKSNLYNWEFPDTADCRAFMSPKLFNHNNEMYLIARKQKGKKVFGKTNRDKSLRKQRLRNWLGYSFSAKTTALFKINKTDRKVEWIMDLPGVGDTAFPSIVRLDQNRFLFANYSSPTNRKRNRSWLSGQLGRTGIYLQIIEFIPCTND